MLKIKDNVELEELKKFGFKENSTGVYIYERLLEDRLAYRVYVTRTHHYIQIKCYDVSTIAGSLQDLFYDLIKADIVEKVEV